MSEPDPFERHWPWIQRTVPARDDGGEQAGGRPKLSVPADPDRPPR